jgi:hypothetical protein
MAVSDWIEPSRCSVSLIVILSPQAGLSLISSVTLCLTVSDQLRGSFGVLDEYRSFGATSDWIESPLFSMTLTFESDLESPVGQGEGSTVIWIGTGSAIAVILAVICALILYMACRRQSFSSATETFMSEVDIGRFVDDPVTANGFLSEQYGLTADGLSVDKIQGFDPNESLIEESSKGIRNHHDR